MNKPRLIDANEVLNIIRNGWSNHYSCKDMCDEINNIPTAYDIDKVVEQLEECANEEVHLWASDEMDYDENDKLIIHKKTDLHKYGIDCFEKAIEIVKGGAE